MTLDPKETIADVLKLGRKLVAGGAELQVAAKGRRAANTRFALSGITSTGEVEEITVDVSVGYGKRSASMSTNQTDAASLARILDQTSRLAKLAPENPEHMPLVGPQKYLPAASEFDAATAKIGAAERAAAAAAAIAFADEAKLQIAGYYDHASELRAIANSAGMHAEHKMTYAQLTMTARTTEPGSGGSGWAGAYSKSYADIDPKSLARTAVQKGVASQKPRHLDPGRYTVILEPAAVGELLAHLIGAMDRRQADEGQSFFSKAGGGTKLGDKLFPDMITLRSDHTSPLTADAPYDESGLARKPMRWIDKGVVSGLRTSRFWADKQKLEPTANPGVAALEGGTATRDDLLTGVKRGVLITHFFYTRVVDPQSVLITGLTRDGVFLVEDGAIVGPVNNFRFNESPVVMLANAEALSKDTVQLAGEFGAMRVPALRSHGFNLASISEAV